MYADDSSNSSWSSACSVNANMFMIDNLLQKDKPAVSHGYTPHHTTPVIRVPVPIRLSPIPQPGAQTIMTSSTNSSYVSDSGKSRDTQITEASRDAFESEANTAKNDLSSSPAKKRQRLDSKENVPDLPSNASKTTKVSQKVSPPSKRVSPGEKRKSRTSFTNQQLNELEMLFHTKRYLPATERKQLAKTLDLSEQQIKTWFQNRRMKDKRIVRDDGLIRDPLTPLHLLMTSPQLQAAIGQNMMLQAPPMTSLSQGSPDAMVTRASTDSPSPSNQSLNSGSQNSFEYPDMLQYFTQQRVTHSLVHANPTQIFGH